MEMKKHEERLADHQAKGNLDEQIQKKNKEIYELTVQLGCLKEENFQYKKD
jgi:hypothetical protein